MDLYVLLLVDFGFIYEFFIVNKFLNVGCLVKEFLVKYLFKIF